MRSVPDEGITAPPVVRLADVSCRLGRRLVLAGITLAVAPGSIVGVLGPNGAGKSTLLGLVSGVRRPSSGAVEVLGEPLPARAGALRRRIGVVLQETALYEELTTAENLRFTASLYGVPRPRERIGEVLALLGLEERGREGVRTLSGGLRRRIALARALLHDPELLIVDEPTLGVDAEARHAIWAHLRLLRSRGVTVLVATNYLDEAQALCDRVAVLRDGRLIAHEAPDELVTRTGRCLDVACGPDVGLPIRAALERVPGVLRVERAPGGLSVFLDADTAPHGVVRAILAAAPIDGFHLRPADLAEVFQALGPAS
ncbi:MAG: ABC transporter ATP-binding protein [Chloroflexi bacterium]|nr:ABC transporter ATP-binding protein [Chloroflexota bacterium]